MRRRFAAALVPKTLFALRHLCPSPDYLSARLASLAVFFFFAHADFFLLFPPMRSLVPGYNTRGATANSTGPSIRRQPSFRYHVKGILYCISHIPGAYTYTFSLIAKVVLLALCYFWIGVINFPTSKHSK